MARSSTRLFMTILPVVAVAAALSGSGRPASGQNVIQFCPGDAYFYFTLTEELADSLPNDGPNISLYYARYDDAFGSSAGFRCLRIDGVTAELIQNLRRAYREHREDVPKILAPHEHGVNPDESPLIVEANPPHGFIYNREADWSEQRIGLKYNENWPHLPAEAFVPASRAKGWEHFAVDGRAHHYQPLLETYEAVVADWRNACRFAPLKVDVPKKVAWGVFGEPINEPVVAEADDIQLAIVASGDLDDCFAQRPNTIFYQVTKDWVKKWTWRRSDYDVVLVEKPLGK